MNKEVEVVTILLWNIWIIVLAFENKRLKDDALIGEKDGK